MEHEQVVTRCQENDPGGPGAANAWEVRNVCTVAESCRYIEGGGGDL